MVGNILGELTSAAAGFSFGTTGDPKAIATHILANADNPHSRYDRLEKIEAELDKIQQNDPELAIQVRREIMDSGKLTTVETATLNQFAPGRTIDIGGGQTIRQTEDGRLFNQWIEIERRGNTADYRQLAEIAGSHDKEAIKAVIDYADSRAIAVGQVSTAKLNELALRDPQIVQYLTKHQPDIQRYAEIYGVNASSVGGVIGEEMRNVRAVEPALENNALVTTQKAALNAGKSFTQAVEQQYQMHKSSIENGQPVRFAIDGDNGRHAAKAAGIIIAQDIGAGNINFGEAIRLLKNYNATHPNSDPLEVKKYNGDYEALYNDLRSSNSNATIKFATMKVKDVVESFNDNDKIGPVFKLMKGAERDAAIDAGYRTSINALEKRIILEQPLYRPRDDKYDYFSDPFSPYFATIPPSH